jgi:hypothetical protein
MASNRAQPPPPIGGGEAIAVANNLALVAAGAKDETKNADDPKRAVRDQQRVSLASRFPTAAF